MQASAQTSPLATTGTEEAMQFYCLPIRKYRAEIEVPATVKTETTLMDIGHCHAFVTHEAGRKPTENELQNADFFDGLLYAFVEASNQEEAWQKFVSANPGAQGKSPAMVRETRPGRKIIFMPICNEMTRRNGEILCGIRLSEGIAKDQCDCIVNSGWPPYNCPIAEAIKFDFTSPPLPWSDQPPF